LAQSCQEFPVGPQSSNISGRWHQSSRGLYWPCPLHWSLPPRGPEEETGRHDSSVPVQPPTPAQAPTAALLHSPGAHLLGSHNALCGGFLGGPLGCGHSPRRGLHLGAGPPFPASRPLSGPCPLGTTPTPWSPSPWVGWASPTWQRVLHGPSWPQSWQLLQWQQRAHRPLHQLPGTPYQPDKKIGIYVFSSSVVVGGEYQPESKLPAQI